MKTRELWKTRFARYARYLTFALLAVLSPQSRTPLSSGILKLRRGGRAGLSRTLGKRECSKGHRRFESSPLRQFPQDAAGQTLTALTFRERESAQRVHPLRRRATQMARSANEMRRRFLPDTSGLPKSVSSRDGDPREAMRSAQMRQHDQRGPYPVGIMRSAISSSIDRHHRRPVEPELFFLAVPPSPVVTAVAAAVAALAWFTRAPSRPSPLPL